MFDGTRLKHGLCDRCDHHEGSHRRLAHEILGPGILDDKGWVGGHTPEKFRKWRAAQAEAAVRLAKPCLQLNADMDTITLCRGCLLHLAGEIGENNGT